MNRTEQIRRLVESIRRWVKLKTNFGLIPMPVGDSTTLVFHMNKKETGYILLNAQTDMIQGRIEYEEIEQIGKCITSIYREGICKRSFMTFIQYNLSTIIIIMCFTLFVVLLLLLSLADGIFFVETLGIFVGMIVLSVL